VAEADSSAAVDSSADEGGSSADEAVADSSADEGAEEAWAPLDGIRRLWRRGDRGPRRDGLPPRLAIRCASLTRPVASNRLFVVTGNRTSVSLVPTA